MPIRLNKRAYAKLIEEDIEWLNKKVPEDGGYKCEKWHIIAVLKGSVEHEYPSNPAPGRERRIMNQIEKENWDKAREHFYTVKESYKELPAINGGLALRFTFEPLELRFEGGERTQSLFEAMMAVE